MENEGIEGNREEKGRRKRREEIRDKGKEQEGKL